MPVTIYGSDNLSDLSRVLHESLREEIRNAEGLYSPTIVIPNKSMETWLYLDLVQRSGVVFNLRFLFLEKVLEEYLLSKFSPEIDPQSRPFLQGETRKFQIYSVLLGNPELVEKYPILKAFLLPPGRKTMDPIRLLDLSARIAKYFKDYELHRQDWIRNWIGEKYSILRLPGEDIWEEIATQSEIFFFQKELYSYITGIVDSKETLVQYSMRMLSENKKGKAQTSKNLYIFALSQLSSTYISIFQNLLPEMNLKVFQFGIPNDDTVPGLEKKQICRNWANPFRSLRKSWEQSGAEFIDLKQNQKSETFSSVLTLFQNYLRLGNSEEKLRLPADESLVVLETPSKLREVEAVLQSILSHLSDSPQTKLTDIGIFCADLPSYRPAIETIFDGGIVAKISENSERIGVRTLPYTIRDVLAGDTSKYVNAILSIFPLIAEQRSRAELFLLFRNPCFQSKWEIDSSVVEDWSSYAENLELYQDDFREEGTPVSFSFRKGFVRLAAGNILPEDEEESLPVSPFDTGSRSAELWIGIWQKVSSLLLEFQQNISNRNIGSEILLQSFIDLIRNLFSSRFGDSEEEEIEFAVMDSLTELRSFDWDPKDAKDRIRFLELFVKQAAGEIQVRKGKYLTGGITISALQPMRPIPFEHVYVLGLGEGLFPGSDDKSAFNLRYVSPREGDIGLRSLNESLLYETALSAKKSLVLSFVSEDITKDESIAPSSSLLLIEQALKENVLIPESSIRVKIPLNKHSKDYFSGKEIVSKRKTSDGFFQTYDLSSSLIYGAKQDRDSYFRKILQINPSGKDLQKPDQEERLEIDWNELVKFARSPLSYHLQKKFGLYVEEISETDSKSEEPFRISNEFLFLSDLWSDCFAKSGNEKPKILSDSLETVFQIWEKRGNIPRGIYGEVEFLRKAEKIGNISKSLQELFSGTRVFTGISFGESQRLGNLISLPEIVWEDNGRKIKITGLKDNILLKEEDSGSASVILIYPNSSKKLKNGIEPFLLQCLLDTFSKDDIPQSVIAVFGYGDKPVVLSMNRKGQEQIRKSFFRNLIQEFFHPVPSLITPKLWEDFPDRIESVSETDSGILKEYADEYRVWAKESVQYDPKSYLDNVLRLLAYPQNYIKENDFSLCLKLYNPILSVFHAEK